MAAQETAFIIGVGPGLSASLAQLFAKEGMELVLGARDVDKLDALAKVKFGKSVLALAVRWLLDRGDTIALWGARKPSQLDAIGDVMGWHIDDATMKEIDKILDETVKEPVGPEFMAPAPTG